MNKNTITVIAVVLIIVAAVGGFYAGMQFQKSQRNSQFAGRFGGGQGFGARAGGQNGNTVPVRGQILSMGNSTLTVKLYDGSTKIVVLSGSTTFVQSTKASESDLKSGDTVMVIGSANSDGSVTASDVSINPQQFRQNISPTGTQ